MKIGELLELINDIRQNLNKYKINYYNITSVYLEYNIVLHENDMFLVLKSVVGIIPTDDRINYFKIPKTEEDFNEIIKQYKLKEVDII